MVLLVWIVAWEGNSGRVMKNRGNRIIACWCKSEARNSVKGSERSDLIGKFWSRVKVELCESVEEVLRFSCYEYCMPLVGSCQSDDDGWAGAY